MPSLHAHLQNLGFILKHKWFVFRECMPYGLYWQGLIHDASKFLPAEWYPYVEYFHGGFGDTKPPAVQAAFNAARNHHHKANPHHWQYYVYVHNDSTVQPLPIPERYRREMLADWHASSQMQGDPDGVEWYLQNATKIRLHPETRAWIEQELAHRLRHQPERLAHYQTALVTLSATRLKR